MFSIPEHYNVYAGLHKDHTCNINQPDYIDKETKQRFFLLSPEAKISLFASSPKEIRERFKNIAEQSIKSHMYTLPEGYTVPHIVKDLIALSIGSGKFKRPKPKDPPLLFNAEKRTFWLCKHLNEQATT